MYRELALTAGNDLIGFPQQISYAFPSVLVSMFTAVLTGNKTSQVFRLSLYRLYCLLILAFQICRNYFSIFKSKLVLKEATMVKLSSVESRLEQ